MRVLPDGYGIVRIVEGGRSTYVRVKSNTRLIIANLGRKEMTMEEKRAEIKDLDRQFQFHTNITGDNWEEFKWSLREHGQLEPIIVDENGVIISGHQRFRACKENGMEPWTEVRVGLTDQQKAVYAFAVNTYRRANTPEERRGAVLKYKAAFPEASQRDVAKVFGVDQKTISNDLKRSEENSSKPGKPTGSKAEAVPKLSQEVKDGKKSIREAAKEAGISKSAMAREVEKLKPQQVSAELVPDPRDVEIQRLKDELAAVRNTKTYRLKRRAKIAKSHKRIREEYSRFKNLYSKAEKTIIRMLAKGNAVLDYLELDAEFNKMYRLVAKATHPDVNPGSSEAMTALNCFRTYVKDKKNKYGGCMQ